MTPPLGEFAAFSFRERSHATAELLTGTWTIQAVQSGRTPMLGTTAALGAANKAANGASVGEFSVLVSGGVGIGEQRL
jgi:hypothetical protein